MQVIPLSPVFPAPETNTARIFRSTRRASGGLECTTLRQESELACIWRNNPNQLLRVARFDLVVMIRGMSQGRKIKKPFGKRGDPNWMDTIPLTPEFLNRSKVHVRKYGKVRTDLPPAAK